MTTTTTLFIVIAVLACGLAVAVGIIVALLNVGAKIFEIFWNSW